MKILLVSASIKEKSGWGRYSLAVLRGLRDRGLDVSICAEEGNETESFILLKSLNGRYALIAFVHNLLIVRRALRTHNVIHALDAWPYGIYAWYAVLGTRKKLFVSGVGTYSVAPLYDFGKGFFMRRMYARAQKVFCISNYTRAEIKKAGINGSKLETVYMGAPVLPTLTQEQKDSNTHRYPFVKSHHPIILTVGAIKNRKGQLDTVHAIRMLKEIYPDILYAIVGKGQLAYVREIESYCATHALEDNVRMINDADDVALSFLYESSDVFVLSSNSDDVHHHFEGFGLVILEAYQFGVPAVGSRGSGIEDAIEEGITGLLHAQHDVQDIKDKIETVLKNRQSFAQHTKDFRATFDWQKTVMRYSSAYTE